LPQLVERPISLSNASRPVGIAPAGRDAMWFFGLAVPHFRIMDCPTIDAIRCHRVPSRRRVGMVFAVVARTSAVNGFTQRIGQGYKRHSTCFVHAALDHFHFPFSRFIFTTSRPVGIAPAGRDAM
jgi:hypothetical protein